MYININMMNIYIIYFYFRLIPNFDSGSKKKKTQMIQLVNKQIHKLIFGGKNP